MPSANPATPSASPELARLLASLQEQLSSAEIDRQKLVFDTDVPAEVIALAAIVTSLAESAREHADELEGDGFTLKAEEANRRAERFETLYEDIRRNFG